jgi:hypothetical protein
LWSGRDTCPTHPSSKSWHKLSRIKAIGKVTLSFTPTPSLSGIHKVRRFY